MNILKSTSQITEELVKDDMRKIVVYDTSRGFSRFIKTKLGGQYDVTVINSKLGLKKYKITSYCTVFYIVNDPIDVLQFENIYENAEMVFLGIAVKNLEKRFVKYTTVIPIDLNLAKKDLMDYILLQLQTK